MTAYPEKRSAEFEDELEAWERPGDNNETSLST